MSVMRFLAGFAVGAALGAVAGVLLAIVGAMLMPVWNSFDWAFWKSWGTDIINIIICACLIAYIF